MAPIGGCIDFNWNGPYFCHNRAVENRVTGWPFKHEGGLESKCCVAKSIPERSLSPSKHNLKIYDNLEIFWIMTIIIVQLSKKSNGERTIYFISLPMPMISPMNLVFTNINTMIGQNTIFLYKLAKCTKYCMNFVFHVQKPKR